MRVGSGSVCRIEVCMEGSLNELASQIAARYAGTKICLRSHGPYHTDDPINDIRKPKIKEPEAPW